MQIALEADIFFLFVGALNVLQDSTRAEFPRGLEPDRALRRTLVGALGVKSIQVSDSFELVHARRDIRGEVPLYVFCAHVHALLRLASLHGNHVAKQGPVVEALQ
ncbi:hypothetical protein PHYPSEUDO_008816 [Phytophthora pseudosyringae]|uniref:Uncharacterized protein n=1 Tax=Phytophthora pseudosyringae TaxID=221518 RepID=A0A8T1WDL3_9STRA|nr:hypothetical protein PHYPSEUDO_008816 [Phytophthora pseudosyringae]